MATSNGAVDLSLLDEVFEQYQGQHGALIPILQKAQDKYGYLPPEAISRIAKQLGISVSKVYGVATFYAQFYLERRGRHILRLCDGTACHVRGTPMLATAVEEQFGIKMGETTEDGELTAEVVYCIGSCALAPVAILDGEVMGRMKQDKLLRTIKKTIKAN
ncbi:MAG TPA: NADH-quinone oxidoreductase subunit NuoE [Caldilineae bacterium]|nr:NADH-quinone oxidoreductase subunit NuoE [Caldilineae bacterium]